MAISYDYYRIFYYVAKYKNFTQAANALMNNQPNISRSISNLEHELGCRLFVRSNRGVTLTPEGEKLYTRVAVAHRQLQAAEAELAKERSLQSGMISVGVSETALHVLLLSRIQEFHKAYPGIRIRISSVSTPQAITTLKSGLVDFAVVTTPTKIIRPLEEILLRQYQEVLIGGPRFKELQNRTLSLKELASHPLILMNSQSNTHDFYMRFFLEHGMTLQPEIEASSVDQIFPMIKNDLGLGFLPEDMIREAVREGEVFPLKLEYQIPKRSICLIRDTDRPMSISATELIKLLKKS